MNKKTIYIFALFTMAYLRLGDTCLGMYECAEMELNKPTIVCKRKRFAVIIKTEEDENSKVQIWVKVFFTSADHHIKSTKPGPQQQMMLFKQDRGKQFLQVMFAGFINC